MLKVFKKGLRNISCCSSVGELISRIRETIDYYNTERIHITLQASPNEFLAAYCQKTKFTSPKKFVSK